MTMINNKIVFLFSGQGSQYRQMGRVLYENNRVFRQSMDDLDVIAQKQLGLSIVSELYAQDKTKAESFDQTHITHPAIYMFEISLARTLIAAGIKPTALVGVSLGEFAAAVVAGMISAQEMLSVVINSALIINEACQSGGMSVVLGGRALFYDHLATYGLSLAGVYAKDNFVISGSDAQLLKAQHLMKELNVVTARLPVTHAFHSSEIQKSATKLKKRLSKTDYQSPKIPFYSSATGSLVTQLSTDHFIDVACNAIDFPAAVFQYIGENNPNNCHSTFIDIAPSGSLTTLLRAMLSDQINVDFKTLFSPYTDQLIDYKEVLLKDEFMLPTKKTACLFPGQGAQIKGMGQALFDKYPKYIEQANQILGWSVENICLNDPDGCLKNTLYTQPCLFVVNTLAYLDYLSTQQAPDYVMGHSLGEYNALFAAGVITFEQGVKLVKKRAELMAEAPQGAMAAVIGLADDKIRSVFKASGLNKCYIANKNSPTQTIISGDSTQIKQAKLPCTEAGCKAFVQLPVSGAFHSSLMQQAALEFGQYLKQFDFKSATIPVVSNVTAKPHGKDITSLLTRQVIDAVDWLNGVEYLLDQEVETFVELSDKKVVTKLVKEITEHWSKKRDMKTAIITPTLEVEDNKKPLTTTLGNPLFLTEHQVRLPYVCGGMVHGIASPQMVIKCAKAGILSFLGTGALHPDKIEQSILEVKQQLTKGETFGVNLLSGSKEEQNVALLLKHNITRIEAAAFIIPSEPLVLYRLRGLSLEGESIQIKHKVLAKLSRPEVASSFLAPAPEKMVQKLLSEGKITKQQAEIAAKIPLADDICVEADSGGHTDQGVTAVLLPAILQLRDEAMTQYGYEHLIRVGSGGGIGTPASAASAFVLGADFILTGSINQCTVEAGTSDQVKSMLQNMRVQDTAYAPAGDMFELGARVQVLKRGVFFPARANRLYDLYTHHDSLDDIDSSTIELLEKEYFKKTTAEVWQACLEYRSEKDTQRALNNPKLYMAYIFKWYFAMSNRLALVGKKDRKVDFQIHTGPALGAFNQWVKGTALESWQARHVDEIGDKLMQATEELLRVAAKKFR